MQIGSSPEGALVTVRVRPRSNPGAEIAGGRLVLRVPSPPVEGRATEEARRALAGMVGIVPSRVRLIRGGRSRDKTFLLTGIEPERVRARLGEATGEG